MKKALLVGGLLATTLFTGCVQSSGGVNNENTASLTTNQTATNKAQKGKNLAAAQANQNNNQLSNKMSDAASKMADKAIDKAADKIGEAGERLMDRMINKIFSNF